MVLYGVFASASQYALEKNSVLNRRKTHSTRKTRHSNVRTAPLQEGSSACCSRTESSAKAYQRLISANQNSSSWQNINTRRCAIYAREQATPARERRENRHLFLRRVRIVGPFSPISLLQVCQGHCSSPVANETKSLLTQLSWLPQGAQGQGAHRRG
eukprot:scaffold27387_cov63-Phaeocystis_antarctica.AAC.5